MVRSVLIVLAFLFAVPGAYAHSEQEIVVPDDGTSVSGSPPEIKMVFDNAMRITQIRLADEAGKAYALARTDRMAPVTEFVAKPQELPPGNYTVEWRGIALDGHTMDGRWSFSVE